MQEILHQFIGTVVYPTVHRVLYIPRGARFFHQRGWELCIRRKGKVNVRRYQTNQAKCMDVNFNAANLIQLKTHHTPWQMISIYPQKKIRVYSVCIIHVCIYIYRGSNHIQSMTYTIAHIRSNKTTTDHGIVCICITHPFDRMSLLFATIYSQQSSINDNNWVGKSEKHVTKQCLCINPSQSLWSAEPITFMLEEKMVNMAPVVSVCLNLGSFQVLRAHDGAIWPLYPAP